MPATPFRQRPLLMALVAGGLAFALYRSTMLPGLELGDSASFQTMAGADTITPRDGYPLYYAIAMPFAALISPPARAMNVVSVVEASAAVMLITVTAAAVSGSALAGAAVALLFAGSYTFWSQAVIAEVYGLHILLCSLSLFCLLRWGRQPDTPRLAVFFLVYAISFGNHLSMILLAPAAVVYLAARAAGGFRSLLAPRVTALAGGAALLGALQYVWNLTALWHDLQPPGSFSAALAAFWFDVTKADWRDTMILQVPPVMATERLQMYWFDLRQQFGLAVPALAILGAAVLLRRQRALAALLLVTYLVTTAFALGYNVGDAHVFFLPSNLALALLAAPALAWLDARAGARGVVYVLALMLAAARIYADYPALDRSGDRRPEAAMRALTEAADERSALLITDLNWQLQNGLTYYGQHQHPEIAYVRLPEVLLYAPVLIRDNMSAGRRVLLTERARHIVGASYGPLVRIARDEAAGPRRLSDVVGGLAGGASYVLTVLRPSREFPLDRADLLRTVQYLTGGSSMLSGDEEYAVVAGSIGLPASLSRSSARPFRSQVRLDATDVTVRLDSWLTFDTIRRMGFGHVIAGRTHAQILERGINLVVLDRSGAVIAAEYRSGIFAPQPRFMVEAVQLSPHAIVEP
jgi:hypothetical protein